MVSCGHSCISEPWPSFRNSTSVSEGEGQSEMSLKITCVHAHPILIHTHIKHTYVHQREREREREGGRRASSQVYHVQTIRVWIQTVPSPEAYMLNACSLVFGQWESGPDLFPSLLGMRSWVSSISGPAMLDCSAPNKQADRLRHLPQRQSQDSNS